MLFEEGKQFDDEARKRLFSIDGLVSDDDKGRVKNVYRNLELKCKSFCSLEREGFLPKCGN